MGFNLIPFLIIIVALLIIVVVVVRKFPQISAIELETVPEEKAREKKDEIIEERLNRFWSSQKVSLKKIFGPLAQNLIVGLRSFYKKMLKTKLGN